MERSGKSVLLLSNEEVESVLPMDVAVEALENSFRDWGDGKAVDRLRSHIFLPIDEERNYMFKSMDGGLLRYGMMALRFSSDMMIEPIIDGKRRRDRVPIAQGGKYVGLLMLFDIHTTELLTIMQDAYINKMMVGATSAVAAKYLARPDSAEVGLYGTGWLAGPQIWGLDQVRKLRLIKVYSPNAEHRKQFVSEWSRKLKVEIREETDPRKIVDGSDIIAATTNSLDPVFDGDWLRPGMHVNSVQGHELDWRTLERADLIVQRRKELPIFECARVMTPPKEVENAKVLNEEQSEKTVALGDVVVGRRGRTSREQITVFGGSGMGGSGGLGIQYVGIGAETYWHAREKGLGHQVPLDWFLETAHP